MNALDNAHPEPAMTARDDIPADVLALARTVTNELREANTFYGAEQRIARAILADRSSRPAPHEADRDRAAEEERIREAEIIIGKLQELVTNVRGWVERGYSETATKAMREAMDDGWTAMGWKPYLDRAALRSTTTAEGEER